MRRVAMTVLLASVLAMTGGGIAVAEPGHQDGDNRFPDVIALPNGFGPEGISIGKGTTFYVGSVANGAIYRGDVKTGKGKILVDGVAGKAATGNKVDERNRLWVSGAGTGTGTVYDADSGRVIRTYHFVKNPPPNTTFINDVIITKDAAYFTDSVNPVLYVVPIGRGGRLGDFYTLPLTGDLVYQAGFNANGIEASPDGRTLLVVQSNTGLLFSVSAKTGVATRVDLGGVSVSSGDGLLLQKDFLYVGRNGDADHPNGLISVFDLDRSLRSGKLIDTITNANFDVPTTLAAFGQSVYVVNARFSTPLTPTTSYTVVRVDAVHGH